MPNETIVQTGHISIAAREYGGSGHPVLLLHGAGGSLAAWDVVGPILSARHRPVAVDLRGHGESGDGPWTWDDVLSDLEAVSKDLGLRRAVVVGHSLGGVLGARLARRNPACPAVVSLDGHRSPVTDLQNYDAGAAGLTADELSRQVAQLSGMFDAQAAASAAPVRPGPETMTALRDIVQSDGLPVFAGLTVPVLLMLATRSVPQLPADLEPLMTAFRAGLRRDVAALAAANPAVETQDVEASHGLLFEKPDEVADSMTSFIARALE